MHDQRIGAAALNRFLNHNHHHEPLSEVYGDQLDDAFDAWHDAQQVNPSPWVLATHLPGGPHTDDELDRLRYTPAGEVLRGLTDDNLTLHLKRLYGIEHLGVYASWWPGYEPKHTLDVGGGYTLTTITNWRRWFSCIERRTETDPDGWPGHHALPVERAFYTITKAVRTLTALSGVF